MNRTLLAFAFVLASAGAAGAQGTASAVSAPVPLHDLGARPLVEGVEVRQDRSDRSWMPQSDGRTVDVRALRYYYFQGDTERFEAELLRLRRQHPNWTPTREILENAPSLVDERPIWALVEKKEYQKAHELIADLVLKNKGWTPSPDLLRTIDDSELWMIYESGDYRKVREKIAALGASRPGWAPAPELVRLLDWADLRAGMSAAVETKNWEEVRRLAEAQTQPFGCDALDLAWSAAEAYARTQATDKAFALYQTLVNECPRAHDRLSTLQKASDLIEPARVEQLIRLEQARLRTAEENTRFETFRDDWRFTRVARSLGKGGKDVTSEDRAYFEKLALARKLASSAEQIGWSYHRSGRFDTAAQWFERALAWGPSAKAAEGLAYTYKERDQDAKALAVVEKWKAKFPALETVEKNLRQKDAPSPVLAAVEAQKAGDYAKCIQLTEKLADRDVGAAQVRGWCFTSMNRPHDAIDAFSRALDLAKDGSKAKDNSAYGLALAYLATENVAKATEVARQHRFSDAEKAALMAGILQREAEKLYAANEYRRFLQVVNYRRQFAENSRELQIMEGWALYHMKRPTEAYRVFLSLHRQKQSPETQEGLRVTRDAIN